MDTLRFWDSSVFSGTQEQPSGMIQKLIEKVWNDVDMTNCVYRGKDVEDPTCWIVTTLESRTCISYTTIPELTANEYLANISRSLDNDAKKLRNWFHFEGRNLDQVLLIVDALRERYGSSILISIEFEKIRKGMDELLPKADVCFFSRPYAEGSGYPNAPSGFLDNIRSQCKPNAKLIVTWGKDGAYGLHNVPGPKSSFHCPGRKVVTVDTIGAGDAFIGAFISKMALIEESTICDDERFKKSVEFGVSIAGIKCSQLGFEGLLKIN